MSSLSSYDQLDLYKPDLLDLINSFLLTGSVSQFFCSFLQSVRYTVTVPIKVVEKVYSEKIIMEIKYFIPVSSMADI